MALWASEQKTGLCDWDGVETTQTIMTTRAPACGGKNQLKVSPRASISYKPLRPRWEWHRHPEWSPLGVASEPSPRIPTWWPPPPCDDDDDDDEHLSICRSGLRGDYLQTSWWLLGGCLVSTFGLLCELLGEYYVPDHHPFHLLITL